MRAARSACRPFQPRPIAAGFAIGEAAAAFVLESAAHAQARGADAEFHLAGYATNCDGVHITNPDPAGQARAMAAALADAGLAASAMGFGYLNAHGTATLNGDAAEADSIARVFGAKGVPVSSTKAIHAYFSAPAARLSCSRRRARLAAGRVPPTAHTLAIDPAFAIDLVTIGARSAPASAT